MKLFYVSAKVGDNVAIAFADMAEKLTTIHPKLERKEEASNAVVSNIMKKKKEFQLRSGGNTSVAAKKGCC